MAITYGVVGNILTLIATNFAERLVYLPSAFFLMLIGTLIAHLPLKPRAILLTIVLTLASIRTVTAAREWNHPLILFQHALANQPQSPQLRILLSRQYHEIGNLTAANSTLRQACDMYPDYWRLWMYRAIQDMDDGNLPDADISVKRAIKLKGDPSLIPVADRLEKLKAKQKGTTDAHR
jgi:predicted Zn-dependent protease